MSFSIPLMRPVLPSATALLPYLHRIDDARHYTNFGPLQHELAHQLTQLQQDWFGRSVHAVCVSSATLGLELALSALNLPPASKVAIPALTFVATATSVIRAGHVPIALDVDPETWLLSPDIATQALTQLPELAAVMPVATYGMPHTAQQWSDWYERTGVPVIIDAAGAIGAQATASGVTVVFSLHATKPLSASEGGLIFTEDENLADRLRCLTNFGIGHPDGGVGTNAKLSEYHAAVGLADLQNWSINAASRMRLHDAYVGALKDSCGWRVRFQKNTGLVAPCIFSIRFENQSIRFAVEQACAAAGIQTRRWYTPLVQNQNLGHRVEPLGQTAEANSLEETLVGLPFFMDLSPKDMERVISVVSTVVGGH